MKTFFRESMEVEKYMPTSLTVTFFDVERNVYGFTFNTVLKPVFPVIRIKKANEGEWKEFPFVSVPAKTFDRDMKTVSYYISKAELRLEEDTVYSYFILDKEQGVRTAETKLRTGNRERKSFCFAHVGDSQEGPTEFKGVLSQLHGKVDFTVHTGDFVQRTKYEYQWTEMLDGAYEYLSATPMMPLSGNHEAKFGNSAGRYEMLKHFNNGMPTGQSLAVGYYYSFVYGDVKFIMLNTNDLDEGGLLPDQYEWLLSELEANECRWTVVSMHNPIYSVGQYGADPSRNGNALALGKQLRGIFAQYGVDIVLQGHDHAISRTYPINGDGEPEAEVFEISDGIEYSVDPDGVIYVMNGPAGTQVRVPVKIDESLYSYAETSKAGSWAEICVGEDTMTVCVKWYDGEEVHTYHKWGIKKTKDRKGEKYGKICVEGDR